MGWSSDGRELLSGPGGVLVQFHRRQDKMKTPATVLRLHDVMALLAVKPNDGHLWPHRLSYPGHIRAAGLPFRLPESPSHVYSMCLCTFPCLHCHIWQTAVITCGDGCLSMHR